MKRIGRSPRRATKIAKLELWKEKEATKVELFLLLLTLLSTSALLILLSSHYLMTGYAVYLNSSAGDITELLITKTFPTPNWNGVFGVAMRFPGYFAQDFLDLDNEIRGITLLFNCMDTTEVAGNEVYASTSSTIDFGTLVPLTTAEIDTYTGCSGQVYCAVNTFTDTMEIMVGTQTISNIPSTYTLDYGGNGTLFNIGALKDGSGNLVFVTQISDSLGGYGPETTANYQMLLPTPEDTELRYYFFTDPNDVCPAGGGVGNTVTANVYGYIKNISGGPVENATVTFVGTTQNTTATGLYNFTMDLIEGTFSIIAQKSGFDDAFSNATITFNESVIEKNITLLQETPGIDDVIITHIQGYVLDSVGLPIYDAEVSSGGISAKTDLFGYYSIFPSLIPKNQSVIAIKQGYDNNITIVDFSSEPSDLSLNFTLHEAASSYEDLLFSTGPYTYQKISNIVEQAIKNGDDYWVSTKEVKQEVRKNTFIEDTIGIYNFGGTMTLTISLPQELEGIVSIDKTSLVIPSNSFGEIGLTFYGVAEIGRYQGNISISGSLNQEIPVTIDIVERRMPIETMLIKVDLFDPTVRKGGKLKYKLTLQNLLSDQGYIVYINSKIKGVNNSIVYAESDTQAEIASSLTLLEELKLPEEIPIGEYILEVQSTYLNLVSRTSTSFNVIQPIYLYAFLGIQLWIYLVSISFLSFIALNIFVYKRHMDKKKRYSVSVDFNSLPGPGEMTAKLGHIAETNKNAYLELNKLKVHTIVAGATGMGKSISAQVLIEEALLNNVCVIVFDPTAQWSGMLRKCDDKKMFSFYPKFGMKTTDARGFPGNIRAVKNARQIIDINKYFDPGHIQIFTLNKLQPKDMDIFVANTIRQIFKSDPQESQDLKILLVFDEVHRLLPKFGGSGEGFLQIERGCREFRKWGLGQILISQVMNDFVGEIKANINTEIQTRTVEEGDLERIKTKFGESFLKSLVKSEVGVAMFQNAEYNKGLPYFINFRPILHNTRRLSDEELEKYNKYNDQIDELEYQVKQLEDLKIDVFDLKMEIKLVKDKVMTGNFSVVDIYLEGLIPRITKQWEKIGKKPKKLEIQLADMDEIKKSIEEAKKGRAEAVAKSASEKTAVSEAKKDPMEELNNKQVDALTFDNGAMISCFGELKDMLPTLDDDIFKTHVNAEKNDIAEWIKQISPSLSAKLKPCVDKTEMVKIIEAFDGKDALENQNSAGAPSGEKTPVVKATVPKTKPAAPAVAKNEAKK